LNIARPNKHTLFHVVLPSDSGPLPPASIEAEIAVDYWTFEWLLKIGREHRKDFSAIDPDADATSSVTRQGNFVYDLVLALIVSIDNEAYTVASEAGSAYLVSLKSCNRARSPCIFDELRQMLGMALWVLES
jgi:hypothetical protein